MTPPAPTRIAFLDCFAGISGDMLLGALLDAGVPVAVLQDAAAAMHLNASLQWERVDRSGISSTKVHVLEGDQLAEAAAPTSAVDAAAFNTAAADSTTSAAAASDATTSTNTERSNLAAIAVADAHSVAPHAHPHPHSSSSFTPPTDDDLPQQNADGRSLTEIRALIQRSSLAAPVQALALRAFNLLGHAEARIHNVPVDRIHFHEVGAVDAIVDIVAAAAGLVHLEIAQWHCSPVNVGGGTVRCAHGLFPVPAPATAALLRGAPTYSAHIQKELVTPTGAALLRALEPTFGPQPTMAVERIGYGAGTRNPAGFPNVLRLLIGEATAASSQLATPTLASAPGLAPDLPTDTVAVLETALDDSTPQLLAWAAEQALVQGALDVMLTPVLMKKGRPGTLLTLLCRPEDSTRFQHFLLRETTTLGVRIRYDGRVLLDRAHVPVATPFGTVRIKTGTHQGELCNSTPEYEDCRAAALRTGTPLKQVQAAALAAFRALAPQRNSE